MPSVRYYNQTAPFWDFIANMEEQGQSHPFFAGNADTNNDNNDNDTASREPEGANPWNIGPWTFPFGPMPYRGHHGPPHHSRGPLPPPQGDHEMTDEKELDSEGAIPEPCSEKRGHSHDFGHGHGHRGGVGRRGHYGPPHDHHGPPPPPPGADDGVTPPSSAEKEHDSSTDPSEPRGPPPPFGEHPHHHSHGGHRRGGGMRARGRCGGRGGWGGRARGHPAFGGPIVGFAGLAEMLQSQIFGEDNNNAKKSAEDFKPDIDIFDTPDSFVVHVSLPGAKKEDVGVDWDAEKSELNIAGVIYRPGDEELLKTLALDERKVGAFERKVRLGSRASPAQVDVDGISAKMEDGVLRVDVPKLESGFVEVRKVDVE